MKLYSLDLSNFATKTRIAIYEKGLAIESTPPPGGMNSDEYKKLNPLGKIPALQLDDGTVIAESEVINEFLEDKSPEKPLLPKGAESRARVRRLTRFNDLYLDPPARALLPLVFGRKLDDSVVHARLAEISSRLDLLESIIGSPWAAGEWFTLADAALTPTFFFIVGFTKQLGSQDPLEGRPRLSAWWTRVHEYPSTERALAEQESALNAILKK